jgi:hypothetical protein
MKKVIHAASLFMTLSSGVGLPQAQSIAASLPGYAATLRVSNVAGINAKSFSGVAFHPETHTLSSSTTTMPSSTN